MNDIHKKKFAILAGILVVGLFLALSFEAPAVKANAFTDFLGKMVAPLNALRGTPLAFSTSTELAAAGLSGAPSSPARLYQPAIDYENAVIAAVKKASPAVVSIVISKNVPIIEQCPYDPFGNVPSQFRQFFGNDGGVFTQPCDTGKTRLQEVGGGSGFIISSDGLILTNKHVVSDAKASYTVITNEGKKYDAKVLARDANQDLAVVKISAAGLPTVTLGDSDSAALGQAAIAIGNTLGEFSNTVSVGVISGLSRTVTAGGSTGGEETIQGVIQTDAAINPGNSGGPLLNLRGEVIGINTAIASDAQNVGFAIPINRAKHDITSVTTTGEIQTPYLGVRYLTITPDMVTEQKLAADHGALVRGGDDGPAIQPNSPAAAAGVQTEDIITAIGGQALDGSHALSDVIAQHNVGDVVTLTVNRAGKELTLTAKLAKRPPGR